MMRILLVSPFNDEGSWLQRALEESGYSLQRARRVPDGTFLAAEELFDVVIVFAIDSSTFNLLQDTLPKIFKLAEGRLLSPYSVSALVPLIVSRYCAREQTRASTNRIHLRKCVSELKRYAGFRYRRLSVIPSIPVRDLIRRGGSLSRVPIACPCPGGSICSLNAYSARLTLLSSEKS